MDAKIIIAVAAILSAIGGLLYAWHTALGNKIMAKKKEPRQYMTIRRYDGVTTRHEWYSRADYQSALDTIEVIANHLMEGHEFECVVMPAGKCIRVTKGNGPTHTHIEDLPETEDM